MAGVACQGIWHRGGCLRCGGFRWGGFRWGGFRVGGSCEVGWTAAGWLCRCSRGPRVQGVVGVAHSRASGVGGNRGIMRNSLSAAIAFLFPCAQPPLTARGSKTATHHDRQKIPSFQQKTTPVPQSPRPPMCNIEDNRTRQAHPPRPAPRSVHFRLEIGPAQPDQTDVEARTTSSRAKAICHTSEPSESSRPAEPNRSRCGVRPISARVTTDLDAESDRSRHGL